MCAWGGVGGGEKNDRSTYFDNQHDESDIDIDSDPLIKDDRESEKWHEKTEDEDMVIF